MPFDGPVNSDDVDRYRMGSVRSFESYLNFSGIHLDDRSKDENRCRQLYWTPYQDVEPVKKIVQDQLDQDWMFYPPYDRNPPADYVVSAGSLFRVGTPSIQATGASVDNSTLLLLAFVFIGAVFAFRKHIAMFQTWQKKESYKH